MCMRRRVGVLAVMGLLLAMAACSGRGFVMPVSGPPRTPVVSPSKICPSGTTPVRLRLPDVSQVTVNVYNGTSQPGLAETVAGELKSRRLKVGAVRTASNGPYLETIIRFGPESVGAAWLLRAYFPDARSEFDRGRAGPPVDVILGTSFRNVPTTTEVNQAVAANGLPVAPPGTCPAD